MQSKERKGEKRRTEGVCMKVCWNEWNDKCAGVNFENSFSNDLL